MSTLFISDLHLSPDKPHLTALFFKFIKQQATQARALYILGDFFDTWIGDDDRSTHHLTIINALKSLVCKGIPVYFMVGNRDFLIGRRFCQESACTLLSDPSVIDLYGTKTLLKHGDDLCVHDKSNLLFRKIARSYPIKKIYLALPITWRQALAKKMRSISQKKGANTAKEISDIPADIIALTIKKYGVQQFIHGHTHRPSIHTLCTDEHYKRHIVLSDWDQTGNYCIVKPNGELRLIYFS